MSVARAVLADLARDPEALAELRRLVEAEAPRDRPLSATDVAAQLGVSVRTVNRWASTGRLSGSKVGRAWRFDAGALELRPAAAEPPLDDNRRRPRHRRSESARAVAAAMRGE